MPLTPQINVGTIAAPNDTIPLSFDGLATTDFKLIFPKLPMVNMFLQTLDIRVTQVERHTRFVDINEIGEKIDYQPFNVSFLVDKNLYTYKEIYDWMKRMTVAGTKIDDVDNPYVLVGPLRIVFIGAWPTSLDRLSFKANEDDTVYIQASASFNYDYIEIDSI